MFTATEIRVRLRFLLPCPSIYPEKTGGMEIFNSRFAEWLGARADAEPIVVTMSRGFGVGGGRVLRVRRRARWGGAAWIFGVAFRAARLRRSLQAVLFSYARAPAWQWRIANAACRILRLPYVVYVHGGGAATLETAGRVRRFFSDASSVFCVSDDLSSSYTSASGRPCSALAPVMPFSTSALDSRQAKASLGLPGSCFMVLCAGSLKAIKGQDVLIDSLAGLLDAERPDEPVYLVLAGGGDPTMLADRLDDGVERKRVLFLGAVPPDELRHVYRAADIYVQPSRVEGMPISLLEAAWNRLPVVVSDLPSLRSSWQAGVDCLKAAPGDVSSLTDALRTLLDDPTLRQRLGAAAASNPLVSGSGQETFESLLQALRSAARSAAAA
jgi:glycosyltransferase involved in cell wall biosynthesis